MIDGARRGLWLVLTGRLVSGLGTNVHTVALASFVLTRYSPRVYGSVVTLSSLPLVAFALVGGVLSDRYRKSRVMAATDIASGMILVALFLLATLGRLPLASLYLLVSLSAGCSGIFAPAAMAILPSVVAPRDLGRANSLAHLSDSAVRAVGPGLGGALVAAAGAVPAFLLNGVSFVLSGLSELAVREEARGGAQIGIRDLRSAVSYYRGSPTIAGMSVVTGLLNFVGAPLFFFGPIYATEVFDRGPVGVGLTFVAVAVGGMVFSAVLLVRRDFRRKGLLVFAGTAVCGGLTVLLATTGRFWAFLAILAGIGSTFALNITCINLLLQRETDPAFLGRVVGLYYLLCMGLAPLGYGLYTVLLTFLPMETLMVAAGIGILGAAGLFLLVPRFVRI